MIQSGVVVGSVVVGSFPFSYSHGHLTLICSYIMKLIAFSHAISTESLHVYHLFLISQQNANQFIDTFKQMIYMGT